MVWYTLYVLIYKNGKVIKVFHLNTVMDLFPNFDFGYDGRVEDHNDSIQSSY